MPEPHHQTGPLRSARTLLEMRSVLLLQLGITLAVLALVPGNGVKLLVLIVAWAATFRRATRGETLVWLIACVLFSAMDVAALRQGQFWFRDPDLLGLPLWEFFIWGFYLLHAIRMVDGDAPRHRFGLPLILAILFAIPFAVVRDPIALFVVTACMLGLGLIFLHTRQDLAYLGYMILLGALVEYTGVWSGQWAYREPPAGGVPLWFITMWGGIGLFAGRIFLPLIRYIDRAPKQVSR